jgi:hypothetical protein
MDDEISDKAKKSLADAARQRAFRRLECDGANSTAALQRRVRALAEERNIPTADLHKLMYKKPSTHTVMVFCEKYKVSYDWILCGDLQGLRRMTQAKALPPPEMTEAQRKEVTRLFLALSPKMQAVALGCMEELATREAGKVGS